MDGAIEVVFVVGGHRFVAAAALSDGTLTMTLTMPSAFLAGADDAQRRAYGEARDLALREIADALHYQREGETIHHVHH